MMDARALVAYVGFYPVIRESGEHAALPSLSLAGSRIARHALFRAAVNAVRCSIEWRRPYQRKIAQGNKPKQALIAVAVKWLHTAYAMLKHRAPYDPSRLVATLATISP
jgi:transposase